MKHLATALIGVLAALAWLRPAPGEVFVLSSGGRIEGELLNPDEKPRKTYTIKLASGGQISLEAAQVKQVITARPDVVEYEKVRPQYPDTVEGQWNLAEWCREHGLPAQRKTHLQRVIELDPEHVEARRLLGYNKIEGQWMTQDEWMIKQGYRRYKNQWKLPQEIELLEGKRKQEVAEKEWFQKISRWRSWLGTDKNKQARQNLAAIDDPTAVKALAMSLQRDQNQDARLIYIETLGRIPSPEAEAVLAICSIDDPVSEIRFSCLDVLEKRKSPQVVAYYVGRLRDKENKIIHRAAIGLSRMKDPSATGPLIDALITSHKQKVGSGNPGQMTMTFPTGGTRGGMGMGMNQGPKIIRYEVANQPVLDALVTITGQNFSFDQRAWRTWFAAQNRSQTLDARRN